MRWLVLVFLVGTAHAQPTSPGPLGASHAALACEACHPSRTAAVSCAGCHDALVQRGLHTKPMIAGKPCTGCHLDHRGAQFDLSGWQTFKATGFAHDLVWKLNGKHAAINCVQCHTGVMASGRTRFSGLSTTCGSAGCHQANPHRFAGPEFLKCDRCHGEAVWKPAKATMDFDHDRETKMPLVGAHRDVTCFDCHPKGEFATTKVECSGCHKSPKHQSPAFDARPCEPCHAVERKSFAAVRFDHEQTKFPLVGGGHRIACARCHTQKIGAAMPSAKCESCHPSPTPHGNRFDKLQGGCAACHDAAKWKSANTFTHGKTTGFPLVGKHADISCRTCHRGKSSAEFENFKGERGCKECHAHRTVHDNKYTTKHCTSCHVNNMQGDPRPPGIGPIHGPNSPFPLTGEHKNVPCADCHTERTSRGKTSFANLSAECGEKCHLDNAHDGALGKQCSRCHVSGTWEALKFEHQKYPLEGEHVNAACAACHGPTKKFAGAPRKCIACHARDDVHGGALGTACDRCHLANGDNRFNHVISAKFKLDGKHLSVTCDGCHPTPAFKPRPTSCFGCHPEPRAHFGKYGTYCERCHTTKAWK